MSVPARRAAEPALPGPQRRARPSDPRPAALPTAAKPPRATVEPSPAPSARLRFASFMCLVVTVLIVGVVTLNALLAQTAFQMQAEQDRVATLQRDAVLPTEQAARLSSPVVVATWARRPRHGDAGPRRGPHPAGARERSVNRPPVGRLLVLLTVMLFGLTGVMARLSVLQVREGTSYEERGYDQRLHTFILPAQRGRSSTRRGSRWPCRSTRATCTRIPGSCRTRSPPRRRSRRSSACDRRRCCGRSAAPARSRTCRGRGSAGRPRDGGSIEALHLPGIGFLPTSKRSYPTGPLAAQVLGFVGTDGDGLAGLEYQYQRVLSGTPGEFRQEMSPSGQPIAQGVDETTAPVPGDDLVTTIDRQFQYQVQTALAAAVKANHAKGGTVIVMDPHTGDIYAMASYPAYDANAFPEASAAAHRNTALVDAFEPGSVNKVITASAAIEEHAVSLERRFQVPDHDGGRQLHDPRLAPAPAGGDDARRHHRRVQQHRRREGGADPRASRRCPPTCPGSGSGGRRAADSPVRLLATCRRCRNGPTPCWPRPRTDRG